MTSPGLWLCYFFTATIHDLIEFCFRYNLSRRYCNNRDNLIDCLVGIQRHMPRETEPCAPKCLEIRLKTWERRTFRLFSLVSFPFENIHQDRSRNARNVSVERQRIFCRKRSNRIQHQCLRERAALKEKH